MMIKPSIVELKKNTDSRYTLVTIASKRARMIGVKDHESHYSNPVTRAVEEMGEGRVGYVRHNQPLNQMDPNSMEN